MVDRSLKENRIAVVTGGSQGLGLACANRLARDGYRIAVLDIADGGHGSVTLLPNGDRDHRYWQVDVTSEGEVRAAIESVSREMGRPSALVNNAGVLRPTSFLEISEAEWDQVLDVTVKGSLWCMQACLPGMLEDGFGRIVNVSSTAGKTVSTIGGAHYTCAKTALLGLTRAVAHEVAPHGVTVNAVCPGLFETKMVTAATTPAALESYARSFPVGRLGQPAEVGALVSFLCSPDAGYITGAAIDINGGDLMV